MKTNIPVELPGGYIDFYKNLETWQNQQQIKLNKHYAAPSIDVVKSLSNSHKSILQRFGFEIDDSLYNQVYRELIVFLKDARPEASAGLDRIASQFDKLDINVLPAKLLGGESEYISTLANKLDIPMELFVFTIDHALRPFLRMWAAPYQKAISEVGFTVWDLATSCPFCSSKPHFSRLLATDGRRLVFCDRCFTEWEIPTIYCVHCGNSNPHSIQYLTVEDHLAYQILTCDECKGYMKIFDERQKAIRLDLFIANMETIYLDMLAQEKGYTAHDDD